MRRLHPRDAPTGALARQACRGLTALRTHNATGFVFLRKGLILLEVLVLQRYEGSREPMQQADNAFQERDFWKETRHGRQHDS